MQTLNCHNLVNIAARLTNVLPTHSACNNDAVGPDIGPLAPKTRRVIEVSFFNDMNDSRLFEVYNP